MNCNEIMCPVTISTETEHIFARRTVPCLIHKWQQFDVWNFSGFFPELLRTLQTATIVQRVFQNFVCSEMFFFLSVGWGISGHRGQLVSPLELCTFCNSCFQPFSDSSVTLLSGRGEKMSCVSRALILPKHQRRHSLMLPRMMSLIIVATDASLKRLQKYSHLRKNLSQTFDQLPVLRQSSVLVPQMHTAVWCPQSRCWSDEDEKDISKAYASRSGPATSHVTWRLCTALSRLFGQSMKLQKKQNKTKKSKRSCLDAAKTGSWLDARRERTKKKTTNNSSFPWRPKKKQNAVFFDFCFQRKRQTRRSFERPHETNGQKVFNQGLTTELLCTIKKPPWIKTDLEMAPRNWQATNPLEGHNCTNH